MLPSGRIIGSGLRIGKESEDWEKSTAAENLSPFEDVGHWRRRPEIDR